MATNTNPYTQTTKETVPVSTAGTGTITTSGTVKTQIQGSGTVFTTQLQLGGWIYIAAQSQVRRIVDIASDTSLTIDQAFTVDLAASAFRFILRTDNVRELAISVTGGPALINGASIPVGITYNPSKANLLLNNKFGFVDPVVLDATGSTCVVSTLK
jgi:hypothetical protein